MPLFEKRCGPKHRARRRVARRPGRGEARSRSASAGYPVRRRRCERSHPAGGSEEAGPDQGGPGMPRLRGNPDDYAIIAVYFLVVLGIGFAARRYVKTSLDYFLSGRPLPAWITGLAFCSANLGALELLGQAANGAQYGIAGVHFYWIGAIPAMVFLGLVMMPFYYGSKVRSVPEYLRRRFNKPSHLFNAAAFSIATILIAGVNLYALALVLNLMLGWPILLGIVVAAAIVLVYITLGGLSSAIYNEVLQFFVIVVAVVPVTIIGLKALGGWNGLTDAISKGKLGDGATHSWQGLSVSNA